MINTAPIKLNTLNYQMLKDLLPKMAKGQAMVYHVGSLMYDRVRGPLFQTVHGIASAAYEAYEAGEVTLVQRKLGPLHYEYIAIRR